MIARTWKGWTAPEDAEEYENVLKEVVLPLLRSIKGYMGTQVMRKEGGNEVEFMVINFFESLESIKEFAGEDLDAAVFEPEARRLLSRVEARVEHFEVRIDTTGPGKSVR